MSDLVDALMSEDSSQQQRDLPSSPNLSSSTGRPRHGGGVLSSTGSANYPQSDAYYQPHTATQTTGNPDDQPAESVRRAMLNSAIPKVTDATGEKVRESFENFLETYTENSAQGGAQYDGRYYIAQIHGLRQFELSTLYVDFAHLATVEGGVLATAVVEQYYRFAPFLQKGLRHLIKKYEPSLLYPQARGYGDDASSQTVRSTTNGTSTTSTDESEKVFQIAFYNLPLVNRIRDLRTNRIGTLMSISGTVTRTSEVRPELYKASFTCDACRSVVDGVEQIFRYTEPFMCPNATCQNTSAWTLNAAKSYFIDWQKVRIQENSNEIPTGSMPRT
jgi:DNA replication licensing factor MCM6